MTSKPLQRLRAICALLVAFLPFPVSAQSSTGPEESAKPVSTGYYGLLRVRDLTPFGFLRLDMRPAYAVFGPPGNWGVELELGYQNTWALSPNVEQYLKSLQGRRRLGPNEIQAIRDLPGEAYLVDLELGLLDVTFLRKFTEHWGAYAVLSGVVYNGGFLDGAVESFHRTFGFNSSGRPAVNRNDVNVILDLKGAQIFQPDLPEGGLLDPTFGVRYSAAAGPAPWNLVIEGAVKVPIDGARPFLSTGHADFGLQATLQRFWRRHAAYSSLAAVYTEASAIVTAHRTQVVPTLILGYEYKATARTNLIAQTYASPSVFNRNDTDLDGLLKTKYQVSAGVRYRVGRSVLTFALTENFGSFNNTPDIGFQLGWAYSPAFAR